MTSSSLVRIYYFKEWLDYTALLRNKIVFILSLLYRDDVNQAYSRASAFQIHN